MELTRQSILLLEFNLLKQRFSTWGTGTPGGTQAGLRGYAGSSKSVNKIKSIQIKCEIVYLGVCKRGKVTIRGYAEQEILIWGYASTKRLRTPVLK